MPERSPRTKALGTRGPPEPPIEALNPRVGDRIGNCAIRERACSEFDVRTSSRESAGKSVIVGRRISGRVNQLNFHAGSPAVIDCKP